MVAFEITPGEDRREANGVPRLYIRLLGGFQIERGGSMLPSSAWERPSARSIVKVLAVEPSHRLHREQVMEILWPDLPPASAGAAFRKALHRARRALEPDLPPRGRSAYLPSNDEVVSLDHTWVDADHFESVAERLSRVLTLDPTREDIYRRLMELYRRAGRTREALRQFEICSNVLRRELNVDPEPETLRLHEEIVAALEPPVGFKRPSRLTLPAGLPKRAGTPFVGREQARDRLRGILRQAENCAGGAALIGGEAGIGKSRLAGEMALEAARSGAIVLWGACQEEEVLIPYAAFVDARNSFVLSPSTVRRLLHRMDWRWARPRLAPASLLRRTQDPEATVKLAASERAKALAAQGLIHLLFCDECDLHLLPVLRAMGMQGERVRVPTPGQNARHAFFGALDAGSGVVHGVDQERKLAVHFVACLEDLVSGSPAGPLSLVLDSAPTHTATVVQRWLLTQPRVQVLWLPQYTAHEVNPAERVWGLMKDKVAANRLSGRMDFLVAQARRFVDELAPHPLALPTA